MKPGPGVPTRPLLVLSALVLLLHGLVLKEAPGTFAWNKRTPQVVSIRTLMTTPAEPVKARSAAQPAARSPATAARVARAPETQHTPPRAPASPESAAAPPAATPAPDIPAALPPVAVPGSARWHYTVTALHRGVPVTGRAELAWWHDGQRYEATLRIDAPPLPARMQRSTGTLQPHGLAPLRFSERLRSEEAAHFDRDGGRIVFSRQAEAVQLHLGAQDRLSVLLQLGALLAARPQGWSAGDSLVVQTATTRDAHAWRFTIDGPQSLALPQGATDGLKLTRTPEREWDSRLELWFAPGAADGPVRLRLTAPTGEWLDLQWSGTDKG